MKQGRQPRVTPHDRARLIADVEEVGEPVTGRRRENILGPGGVDHQVEQRPLPLHTRRPVNA
jgi:hypothetical protein